MGNDGVRVVPPLQTPEELEQAADDAVETYGKTTTIATR